MAELKCLEILGRAMSITSHDVHGSASLRAACELEATTDGCSGSLSLLASIVSQVLQPEQPLGVSEFLLNHFEDSGVHDGLPYCQALSQVAGVAGAKVAAVPDADDAIRSAGYSSHSSLVAMAAMLLPGRAEFEMTDLCLSERLHEMIDSARVI